MIGNSRVASRKSAASRQSKRKTRALAHSTRVRLLPYIVLLFWTGLIYFRAIPHPFVYDDQPQILRNLSIQNLGGSLEYFRHGVEFNNDFNSAPGKFYRPLFWVSLWGDL